jgi:hypothetical protein
MSDEIRLILDDYKADILREMAEAAGLDITQNGKRLPKAALLEKLHAGYFTPARIQASYDKLTQTERAVLNRLLLRDGETATGSFRREVVRAEFCTQAEQPVQKRSSYYYRPAVPYADGYIGQPHRTDSTVFEDVLARLTYYGLVFSKTNVLTTGSTTYKMQFHPGTILYVPAVVRQHLPEPEPIPPEFSDWQPAKTLAADPALFLRDLYLYWDFIRRNEVPLLKNGLVAKRSLKAINDTLLVPDPLVETAQREDDTGRLYLLRQLLEEMGLAQVKQGRLQPTGKDPLKTNPFWQLSPAEQVNDCLEAWSNLSGFKDIGGDNVKKYGLRFLPARQALLNVLKTQPAHIWQDPAELLEQLWAKDINFLIPDHSSVENQRGSYYYSRYSAAYFYGTSRELLQIFEQLETQFINACLSGFLYQLGVVELGQETAGPGAGQIQTWHAFRLTSLGQGALGQDSPESLPTDHTGKLVVQPNFQIMAIGPVGLDVLARLDLFADREQADRGAFQYRLSRDSVYRAQQAELPVSDIIAFLETEGQADLPQNVRRSLDEWAGHHERIVFRRGVTLLQAANPDLLERLRNEPLTGKFLARPVTGDVALVKHKRQPQLVDALLEQGFLPAISGADPEAADRSVMVEPDGLIRPIHAVPSLHLRGRLAQVAEETETGVWQLTPASVRRAGGSRNKVNRLLDELDKLHRGPLPDLLVTQLKAWGGYYGQANAETLTLLEFSDAAALAELSQYPALQPHLTPFPAGNRALAVVSTDRLDQVKEILAEFGIQVKEGLGGSGGKS